jgi:ketosteroid isomerase-like protein
LTVVGGRSSVEIVKQAFAAFEQRDADGFIAVCRADVVFEPASSRIAGAADPYRGHAGIRRYFEDVARTWQELRLAPEQFHEADGGVVVATGRVYAWGAGRVIDAPAGWLWRVVDRQIAYGRTFETATGALEAAGIAQTGV